MNADTLEFKPWPKIARLSRNCTVTEKIDGTNASIMISETTEAERSPLSWGQQKIIAVVDGLTIRAGSRTRWITPHDDNYGFAAWVNQNRDELIQLGVGNHFGEWWGKGIQRSYGLQERRFSLFNSGRWVEHDKPTYVIESNNPTAEPKFTEHAPACCHVVPILYQGPFDTGAINACLSDLRHDGSVAVTGFRNPEGLVVYHSAANIFFKMTCENDEAPKGNQ